MQGQVDDLIGEIKQRVKRNERTLVTTLTTKMAEDLTEFLDERGIRVKYIHHNIDAMERTELLRNLRMAGMMRRIVSLFTLECQAVE